MEEAGGKIVWLTFDQICDVNRRMIEQFGGHFTSPDNVRNASSLQYILDAIRGSLFGGNLYPTLIEKAAALAYHIIAGHTFFDGNKRTAIHSAWEFLRCNGTHVEIDGSVVELAEAIARREAREADLVRWFQARQT
ncbi:MAG: type II toxin-antitoxin system death-on-curing family toxin [Acidobacteria bacterium]|nr:type II toxin-antitoxin system death-on-curing family toxin [Acidobacteriota bacterium]